MKPQYNNDRSQRLRKPNPRYLDVLIAKQGRSSQKDVNVGAGAIQKEGSHEPDACLQAQGQEILLSLLRGQLKLFGRQSLVDFFK